MNLDAYLARIGYRGPLAVDATTLDGLHRAHLLAVPFENLDIHWGRPITLDDARHYAKIVGERRGGFCYEQNALFGWALRTIGFRVELRSAAVHGDSGWTRPAAHMMLRIDLDEPWIADVGFGENFRAPKRLVDDLVQDEPPRAYRFERSEPADEADGPMWTMSTRGFDGRWAPSYRFADVPRAIDHFDAMCRYQQTSPTSMFVQKRICSQATPTGRLSLSNDEWIVSGLEGSRDVTTVDEATWTRLLADHFGITRPNP
jgi:N-hydroxyarylamine O-acetyltransferase